MAIQVTCDSCFYTFSAKDEHAGRKGKCPECGEAVVVPSGRAAPPRTASRPATGRPSRSEAKPAGSNTPLIIGGAIAGVVILALIGAVAFLVGRSGRNENAPAVAQNSAIPTTPAVANPSGTVNATTPPAGSTTSITPTSAPAATPAGAAVVPTTAPGTGAPETGAPGTGVAPPATPPATTVATAPAGGESKPYASVADLVAAVEPSACRLSVQMSGGRTSTGSGFVVDQEGTIVTNYHVVEEAVTATVVFPDRSQGQVVGVLAADWRLDLAILKIDYPKEKLKPAKLATEEPRKGEVVVTIGAPLGLDFSMSEGKVSSMRDASVINSYGGEYQGKWVQSSAPISPGNSGGPLFNMKGEVIAANTLSLAGEGAQNLNFGTSAENIRTLLAKKAASPATLSPQTLPVAGGKRSRGGGGRPEREEIADESKTERGKKLLSEIKEVLLFDINISFDSSGKITEYVSNTAEKMWKSAGVDVTRRSDAQALMVVVMRFKQSGSSATAKTLEVGTIIMVIDKSGPKPRKVKVWDSEDELGSVSEGSLAKGVIPERMRSKVQEFFGKIRTAYKTGGTPAAAKPAGK